MSPALILLACLGGSVPVAQVATDEAVTRGLGSFWSNRRYRMSGKGRWLRLVAAGLAAAATLVTAAAGGHGSSVSASDPARCVVVRVAP